MNIKCLLVVFTLVFINCANDTNVNADFYDDTTLSSNSNSKTPDIEKHYFPTDLVCIGIFKTSKGANLAMKTAPIIPIGPPTNMAKKVTIRLPAIKLKAPY